MSFKWCVTAFLIICFAAVAHAIPLSEYQNNLKRAVTALDTLSQVDENETEADFQNRAGETATILKSLIPVTQTVQNGNEACTVYNLWFHQELDDYLRTEPDLRPDKLSMILERVKAVEDRVAELEKPGLPGMSKDESKERLSTILSRPEFSHQSSSQTALNKLLQEFIRWLQSLFPKMKPLEPGRAYWVSRVAQIVVVILATALIAFVVFQLLNQAKRKKATKKKTIRGPLIVLGEELQPEDSATDLLSEAEALARKGELRAAIRKAYIALLVELGDRKILHLAQHKTNRDYLKSVSNLPVLHSYMSGMTESFERHWYGLAQATVDDWQNFRQSYYAARSAKG
jgi:hypothetical protein